MLDDGRTFHLSVVIETLPQCMTTLRRASMGINDFTEGVRVGRVVSPLLTLPPMNSSKHAPDLSCLENIERLAPRSSPYWNILEYCRHIGVEKQPSGNCRWMARIRSKDGKYRQKRIGNLAPFHSDGLTYKEALILVNEWFDQPSVQRIASQPIPVGTNSQLKYSKTNQRFTVGDAMYGIVEWKRIAAAKTYFETSLSLINHHIIPRLGNLPAEELNQAAFQAFCMDILESAPTR